jgi:replicative DNA helicase
MDESSESGRQGGRRDGRRRARDAALAAADVAKLFESAPPHAIEAEMSLLGAILWDSRVAGDVIPIVRSSADFYRPAHAAIYDAMLEIYDRGGTVDLVTLRQKLVDKGQLEQVGGLDYLVALAEGVPSASNAAHYARIVRDKSTVRELVAAATEILAEAHASRESSQQLLEAAEQRIFRIAQRREQSGPVEIRDLVAETMRILQENDGRHLTGLTSGFADLDEMTSGFQRGEMIVVAARPSMGKTALALNFVEHMATSGHPVVVFSLEMAKEQLVQRMLCARGRIDGQRLRRNMLRREDYTRLIAAAEELSEAPILIDDTPGLSLLAMRSKARRMKERSGIEAIVIDYLQLMSAGTRVESRQVEVSEISRGIKAMARELSVPVICLSQLNRAAEQREGHRPRMSDLRESGSIEQDADVVMMLHREEYYHRADPEWRDANPDKVGVAELIVAKQRNGPTGTVELTWDGDSTAFRSISRASPPSPSGGFGGRTLVSLGTNAAALPPEVEEDDIAGIPY